MINGHNEHAALKVVALGGGHGLPVVLRALKPHTENITAIVTVADDGGSSGKLRRELGVLPPGDLRNNIAALADDEALMTQLFQYRFGDGSLEGHTLGNLLITALASITGSMERALIEAGNVLAIRGRVLPSTLQDVTLVADVRTAQGVERIDGESNITAAGGVIENLFLQPEGVRAYPASIQAILGADLLIVGPGSLYTSILPSLLVSGIADAIRAASAPCIYVCNIAAQPGETDNFSVADHVAVLEQHIGRGVIDSVLCNNAYPAVSESAKTHYIPFGTADKERLSDYRVYAADLTDSERPWRHDPKKLARLIFRAQASFADQRVLSAMPSGD